MGLLLLGLIGGAVVLGIFETWSSPERRALRALAHVPLMPVADVRAGTFVRVAGRVVSRDPTLEAPLSGVPCVAHRSVVFRTDAYEPRKLVALARETVAHDFILQDGDAQLHVRASGVVWSGFRQFHPKMNRVLAHLRAHNPASLQLPPYSRLVATESGIEVGMAVEILGTVTREIDGDEGAFSGYREPPTRVVLSSTGSQPLRILPSRAA